MYVKQWYKYRHKSGVYQIINNITNKSYIGSSNDIATRLSHHFGKQCREIQKDSLWYDMIRYGKENFTINILKYCDIKDLIYYEKYYFELLQPEYNKKIPGTSKNKKGYTQIYSEEWYINHRTTQYRQLLRKQKINNGWAKKVRMINKDNNILYFETMSDTAKYLKKYYNCEAKNIVSKIRDCMLGYRKSYYHCFFESVETIPKGSTFTIDT